MGDETLDGLEIAYAKAWNAPQGGNAAEVLVAELDALHSEVFSGPGPGRELILSVLERGVSPKSLRSALVRALPRLTVSTFASLSDASRQVLGHLRDTP